MLKEGSRHTQIPSLFYDLGNNWRDNFHSPKKGIKVAKIKGTNLKSRVIIVRYRKKKFPPFVEASWNLSDDNNESFYRFYFLSHTQHRRPCTQCVQLMVSTRIMKKQKKCDKPSSVTHSHTHKKIKNLTDLDGWRNYLCFILHSPRYGMIVMPNSASVLHKKMLCEIENFSWIIMQTTLAPHTPPIISISSGTMRIIFFIAFLNWLWCYSSTFKAHTQKQAFFTVRKYAEINQSRAMFWSFRRNKNKFL